ncbi:RasGAP protein, partial [Coemansia sp. RSA 2424]
LASVYQDWARSQTAMRVPLFASAVEAAGYTEVQNLSRRRQWHLVHVATHCLHDVINARHHIPAGLLAICASTMRATKRKFPEADVAKAYSLVGGIFFLRFVNAALTSPNQYGLLDAPPAGTMKTNLKLLARLMQRLSNYSSKPADEWPVDARKFMKANVTRFHSFLASLTTGAGDAKIPSTAAVQQEDEPQQHMVDERDDSDGSGRRPSSESSMPKYSPGSPRSQKSDAGASSGSAKDQAKPEYETATHRSQSRGGSQLPNMLERPQAHSDAEASQQPAPGLALVSTGSTITATSTINNAKQPDKSSMVSATTKNTQPNSKACRLLCNKDKDEIAEGSNGSVNSSMHNPPAAAADSYSIKSMYDIGGQQAVGCSAIAGPQRDGILESSGSGDCHAVVLPLNDLYLLQKYLTIYEDKWAPGEAKYISAKQASAADGLSCGARGLTPMAECLRALGAIPTQVRVSNNHKTRITLV